MTCQPPTDGYITLAFPSPSLTRCLHHSLGFLSLPSTGCPDIWQKKISSHTCEGSSLIHALSLFFSLFLFHCILFAVCSIPGWNVWFSHSGSYLVLAWDWSCGIYAASCWMIMTRLAVDDQHTLQYKMLKVYLIGLLGYVINNLLCLLQHLNRFL